jgi:enamine deaminase RidA (YjgF/YER057c/UK114 family)
LSLLESADEGSIVVNPGWDHYERFTFEPAIRRGNLLFVSGMTATDAEGNVVAKGDIVGQTRYIYEKMKAILEAVGAKPCDVVKTTDFITTTENYYETAEARREFFGEAFPASTGVVVKGLLRPDALIEIEAIAVIPQRMDEPLDD